ncbi:hypothetical protein L915_20868 [Phytophthora nicotianae]|uniref:Uncharacterized protein n=1 Tax=Phytophthora nicotianae TaxID=4792 RepID=W2HTV1_PHYNI|nr:hypothetical protein L915_20868 [Phytophthora nicotianae]ETL25390.1 hypothetical protein L916_20752 [Phytophthora nicotianae]
MCQRSRGHSATFRDGHTMSRSLSVKQTPRCSDYRRHCSHTTPTVREPLRAAAGPDLSRKLVPRP